MHGTAGLLLLRIDVQLHHLGLIAASWRATVPVQENVLDLVGSSRSVLLFGDQIDEVRQGHGFLSGGIVAPREEGVLSSSFILGFTSSGA